MNISNNIINIVQVPDFIIIFATVPEPSAVLTILLRPNGV